MENKLQKNMEWLMDCFPDENHSNGYKLAKHIEHKDSVAYHSGGGYTHLFLHLMDGKVMAMHFMEFEVEISVETYTNLQDYLDQNFNY